MLEEAFNQLFGWMLTPVGAAASITAIIILVVWGLSQR